MKSRFSYFLIISLFLFSSSKSNRQDYLDTKILQKFLDELIHHQHNLKEQNYYDSLGYIILGDPVTLEEILYFRGDSRNIIKDIDSNKVLKILNTPFGPSFKKDNTSYKFQMFISNKEFSSSLKVYSTIYSESWLETIPNTNQFSENEMVNILYLEHFSIRENVLWLSVLNNDSTVRYTYNYLLDENSSFTNSQSKLRIYTIRN